MAGRWDSQSRCIGERRHRGRDVGGRQRHRADVARGAGRQRRDPRERGGRGRSGRGTWSVRIDRSSWLALLVRGHYADKPEIIAAHSSPVMVDVKGSPFFAAADAVTILEQIEGALAYLDTVGTRAEDRRLQARMRLVLTSAHRELHNRMHQAGHGHRRRVPDLASGDESPMREGWAV